MTEELQLAAMTPYGVSEQQGQLVGWCERKIRSLTEEQSDLLDSARVAMDNNWQHGKLTGLANKLQRRIVYYQKIADATKAGYLIVPNFDVEVMAVRVKRATPTQYSSVSEIQYAPSPSHKVATAVAELLPTGEGRYVSARQIHSEQKQQRPKSGKPGETETITVFSDPEYDEELDFPVIGVKPMVMEATARAMALKVFDRIGVVTGRKEDPLVLGQLLDPRQASAEGQRWRGVKRVSFFIAWWLDTRVL
jgi:hypothetical protein